ncbi:MAG: FliO/MopB family protein [Candidatus Rokubacteria bacterium]|nr:FliO/MopB family protein [Candidatus Rokubacteria bacterium]
MRAGRARLLRPAVPLVFVVGFAAFAVASASVRPGGEPVVESATEAVAEPVIEPGRTRRAVADTTEPTARPLAPAPAPTPAKPLVFGANAPSDGTGTRAYATPLDGTGTRAYATPVPASAQMVVQARAGDVSGRAPKSSVAPAPAVVPAPTVAPAPAPSAGDSLAGVGAKLLIGSLILVGALWAVARFAKRLPIAKFLPNADGPIRITARSHLGPRSSLALIEVGATTLLVAMTGGGIQTLHVWSDGVSEGTGSRAGATPVPGAPRVAVPGQLRGLQSWLGGRG